ncbi:hypothetical protein [Thermodesulforhabdus norvegica]|uniref:Uncharacterized protein n=1 Tax=Thermodesulforhabdus norvegica TaxID=39841 RepID=A0A1I4VF01_9BACT|nr:hypothetical protein [Thermodesulforhabdus norvegica]SFM99700.1 hypothetical protein SAMN05660836_02261 [Thermodesulforhabdus norvegica]
MIPCPWPQNPLRKLPAQVVSGDLRLTVNSEASVSISHLGTEMSVPVRCRLCPFLFESECSYPHSPVLPSGRTPKLASWALGVGEGPEAAVEAAFGKLQAWLGKATPAYVILVMLCPCRITIAEIEEALEKLENSLPEETNLCWHLERAEGAASLALLCAWTVG